MVGRGNTSSQVVTAAVLVVVVTEEFGAVHLHRKEETLQAMGLVQVNQKEAMKMGS